MQQKDPDLDYDVNCVFIDEVGFNINMRNNWARSAVGNPAIVDIEKDSLPIIHYHCRHLFFKCSSRRHEKKSAPRKPRGRKLQATKAVKSKKRKLARGKKQRAGKIVVEEPTIEYIEVEKEESKDTTTAHFVKFMNELLDIMDMDERLKGNYLIIDNCTIPKSQPMMRKIESRGYGMMYLTPYSLELTPIEQSWAIVKGEMKRHRLLSEENLSQRIADACNNVQVGDLHEFVVSQSARSPTASIKQNSNSE